MPNLLRVTLGETDDAGAAGTIVEIAANVDDQSPELLAHAAARLMEVGALDVWLTPVLMKKGRPGHVVTVLCEEADVSKVERILFTETTTFGVRKSPRSRTVLDRRHETVTTPFGDVRVKVGRYAGRDVSRSPEYEDCARLAAEKGVPVREVFESAMRQLPENPA